MVLVTPELCREYPALISPDPSTRQRVLEHHFPECRVVPPAPVAVSKLSSIPPTTRQLRSADRPAPTLFMLRPTPDKKPLPRATVPAKPLRREDPLHLKIDVPDMLRRQAEDYEYEWAYYAQFGFASPSGRHVSPPKPKPRRRSSTPTPRLSFSPEDLEASPSVAASAKRPCRGSVVETEDEDPQKPGGEEEKTPVSEPHL